MDLWIKWRWACKVNQTLQPCPNNSTWIYNKSYEGFMLRKCQENTSIGLNIQIELSNDLTLTKVEILFWSKKWSLTQNKSYRYFGVEQMLFMDQVMIQPLSASNSGIKTGRNPDFRILNVSKSKFHADFNDVPLSSNSFKQLELDQI